MDNNSLMEMIDELRGRLEDEKLKRYHLHAEVVCLRKEIQKHKKDNVDFYAGILDEIKLINLEKK